MHHSFLPIVPAYNAEKYVEQTLRSLVTQTYPNLEIVVVDDGSTDGTLHRVESMARKHPQIRVIRQPNLGVVGARNRGIEESRGHFIAPVDADDVWFPNAVTKLVNCFLRSDSRTGVAYGWSVIIDKLAYSTGDFVAPRLKATCSVRSSATICLGTPVQR